MVDLGRIGVWTFALDAQPAARAQELATELESMGFRALWIPEVFGRDPFVSAFLLLAGTEHLVVATGIANIYARDAISMAAAANTVAEAHPDRFLLGLGVSHQPMVEGLRGHAYGPPIATMSAYLDTMDTALYMGAPPPRPPERVLAALGPKMLELARDRASGAHPYLVPPEHTAIARAVLGDGPLLAPEQMVVLDTDPASARAAARSALAVYLPGLPNYANNLRRLGFDDDDFADGLSDRLVDAVVAWGDEKTVSTRVRAHLDAGADHVSIQVLGSDDIDAVMRAYRALADTLL